MVLFIDETEAEEYFIVAGLLAKSEQEVDLAYKRLRKSISNYPLSNHVKEKIFTEFKSTLIDRQFQKIKFKILEEIKELDGVVIYSCYIKKHKNMKQVLKESVYITLLSNIINSIDGPIKVVFDCFNKSDFEQTIISSFDDFDNVESIAPCDSQTVPGLQFADNICSTIRLHLTGLDDKNYYSFIEEIVQKV
ncbi:MAG: DUF3800 domain-containing protein [Bacillota bacterium]|nr:DUF3800 domain-containing protein [Bacillota bacterium]